MNKLTASYTTQYGTTVKTLRPLQIIKLQRRTGDRWALIAIEDGDRKELLLEQFDDPQQVVQDTWEVLNRDMNLALQELGYV